MGTRARTKAALFAALTAAVAIGGCFSFGDLSGGASADDAGGDSNATSDAAETTANDGSQPNDSGVADAPVSDGACPSRGGPSPIRVGEGASSYCIDSTEVTNRHYEQFLSAVEAGAPVTQPPECSWNTNLRPTAIAGDMFRPIINVDWCDAYAFCAWSGKRLCGQIGGGPLPESSLGDPAASQWLAACAHLDDGGTEKYPYGPFFKPTYCNGAELDSGTAVEVGSLKNCVGGYSGLDDMCGNVDEWIDSCDGTSGATDCCLSVGGGFNDDMNSCGIGDTAGPTCPGRSRAAVHSDLGFRCCSK